MAIQELKQWPCARVLLPVPVEGTRLCVNVTIEGAQQRPVVTICWQQMVETIRQSDSVPRAEPPPLIPINDDGDSVTTVELILNELDQVPESDGDVKQGNEIIERRPTPCRSFIRKCTIPCFLLRNSPPGFFFVYQSVRLVQNKFAILFAMVDIISL